MYALNIGRAYLKQGDLVKAKEQLYQALDLSYLSPARDDTSAAAPARVVEAIKTLQGRWLHQTRGVLPAPHHTAGHYSRRRDTEPWQLAANFHVPPVVDWDSSKSFPLHGRGMLNIMLTFLML